MELFLQPQTLPSWVLAENVTEQSPGAAAGCWAGSAWGSRGPGAQPVFPQCSYNGKSCKISFPGHISAHTCASQEPTQAK